MYYLCSENKRHCENARKKAKLICVFVFAYADCWFSHEEAHICCIKIHLTFWLLSVLALTFIFTILIYINLSTLKHSMMGPGS